LDGLQQLQVLGLSKNQLQGSLTGSLGTLCLKTLAIDGNILTGDLAPFSLMNSLQQLYAKDNDFRGKLDHGLLADLQSLIEANLSGNQFEASKIPTHYVFTLSRLRAGFVNNFILGALPEILPDNTVMEYLSLQLNSTPSSIIPESTSNL
jgi:Leucine-rich repeat (LRR) protein